LDERSLALMLPSHDFFAEFVSRLQLFTSCRTGHQIAESRRGDPLSAPTELANLAVELVECVTRHRAAATWRARLESGNHEHPSEAYRDYRRSGSPSTAPAGRCSTRTIGSASDASDARASVGRRATPSGTARGPSAAPGL